MSYDGRFYAERLAAAAVLPRKPLIGTEGLDGRNKQTSLFSFEASNLRKPFDERATTSHHGKVCTPC